MSTMLAPPSPADSGSDISTELGETLMSAVGDDGGSPAEESPGGEGGSEPSTSTPVTEETPGGEEGTTSTEVATTTTDPFPVSEDGKSYIVPKEHFAEWTGTREYVDAVQNRFPTIADAEIAHQNDSSLRGLQYDYLKATPETIDSMLNFWAGGNSNDPLFKQRSINAFPVLADRAAQFLARLNPQAHEQLVRNQAQLFIDRAYQKAIQETDPAKRKELLYYAKATDYSITGKYKYNDVSQLPTYDPNAEMTRQQQEAERQRLQSVEQREGALLQRDFTNFNSNFLDGPKIAQVWGEIDKALAPIKDKYEPDEFGQIRLGVMNDLVAKIKQDDVWFSNHQGEYDDLKELHAQCWRQGQDPAKVLGQRAQYYINDLLVRARRFIPSIAAPRISKATGRKVAAAQPKRATAPTRTQSPPQSAPEKNGNQPYNIREDNEFASIFRTPGLR